MQASGGGRGVYITPSHHYPLGYSLSLDRRLALLQWAQRQRAWIIEDDYDAEFNYDRQNQGGAAGVGRRRAHAVPRHLQQDAVSGAAHRFHDRAAAAGAAIGRRQAVSGRLHVGAGADDAVPLPARGSYAEHLRNMRTLYKARLDVLYDAVHRHLAAWTRPALPQGGLQLVCPLADAATERRLVAAAAERGIRLYGLADFYTGMPQRGRWCSASRPIRRMRSCALSPRWRRCSARCRWKATVKIGLLCVLNWSVLHCLRAVYSAAIRLFP